MAAMWRLISRGILHRRGLSLAVFLVGLITTTAAAIGPFYFRAASESILRDHLVEAPAQVTGIAISTETTAAGQPTGQIVERIQQAGAPLGYTRHVSMTSVLTGGQTSGFQRVDQKTGRAFAPVVSRENQCEHVRLVSGRCPSGPSEAMVSARIAAATGRYGYAWSLGTRLAGFGYIPLVVNGPPRPNVSINAVVVGVYQPLDASEPYWFGHDLFDSHINAKDRPDTVDTVFVADSTFEQLDRTAVNAEVDLYLDPRKVRLDNESALRSNVAAFRSNVTTGGEGWLAATKVGDVLDTADHDRRLLAVSVLVVTLQVGLLAALVLFIVVANAAEVRGPEIALAKLRGYSPARTLSFGLLEPIALITLALPIALVSADLVVRVIASGLLADDTPVALRWPPVLALLAGYFGAIAAASVAGARVLRRPVVEQWRRTSRPALHARPLVIAEIALFVLAIVGLVQLRHVGTLSSGNSRPLALLGPGLLIVVLTTLAVRIIATPLQALARWTRASSRVATFLAVRQVIRRPGAFSLAGLLAITLALAVFSVEASAISRTNEKARARTAIGAPTVVHLASSDGGEAIGVVNRIDPDGAWAMVAAEWLPFGGSVRGPVLAIEASKYDGIGYWRDDFANHDLSSVLRAINVPTPSPVVVRGNAIRLTATTANLGRAPVHLGATLSDTTAGTLDLGRLKPGTHTYAGRMSGCERGCGLTGLTLEPDYGDTSALRGVLTVSRLQEQRGSVWTTVDAGFAVAGGWVQPPQLHYGGTTSTSVSGVVYRFSTIGGPPPPLIRNTAPTPFPMAVDPRVTAGDAPTLSDGNGDPVPIVSVADLSVVPRVGELGSLVDLRIMRAELPMFDEFAEYSVWLSNDAPADAVSRLKAAGLVVAGVQTTSQRFHELTRTGPALGVLLYTMTALAGALLAGAATAVSLYASGRRRLHELAALAVAGARPRTLFAGTMAEIGLLLGIAAIAGVVAGTVTTAIVLPAVPEFPVSQPPDLRYGLHWTPLVLLIAAVSVLVAGAAAAVATALVWSAKPAVLREPAP
ncbi:MAG: hypothetical protein QOG53_1136 [Frankiales bacterium]|jgi:hypothetical protein|nr:hypothetical protein [Frankiales bacterium]